ncbi:MAG: hypothetical protein AAFS11_04340 [Planctomycetota bacterium]
MTGRFMSAFALEAEAVGSSFRDALAALVQADPEGIEPAAVVERFGVDSTLAWKLSRQVSAQAGLDVFRHMPGPAALRGVLGRATDAGASREAIAAFGIAIDAYQDLLRRHAGSRRAFDVLIAGQLASREDAETESRLELDLRRAGYESAAFVQGVKARTQFAVGVLWPNEDMIGLAVLRGTLGLQRLRPNAMWRVSHVAKVTKPESGTPGSSSDVEMVPIDPGSEGGLPIMGPFSSVGQQTFTQSESSDELIEYELTPGEVGDQAAMDLVFGERIGRARPRSIREAGMQQFMHIGGVKTPCERFVYDALVHEELFESAHPAVRVFSTIYARSTTNLRDTDELPIRPFVEERGRGLDGLELSGHTRHVSMLRYALASAGLDERSLVASRITIAFPPVPMTLKATWERPA